LSKHHSIDSRRHSLAAELYFYTEHTDSSIIRQDHGGAHIRLLNTQRGIAPGQVLSLHDGEVLLGGVYR
jgi:tRNA U34 2-thiouridine synthase MnmA/TrmU